MAPRPSAVDSFLPLKPVAFHVLMSLADGERHGYAITQEIAARTSARMRIEPGNLYRSIKALLNDRLIEESDRRPSGDTDDERRRYYRITDLGRRVASAETARLEELVAEAKGKHWLKGRA
jgi:DNA-binding PadR family transcriptional regulator